MKRHFFYFLFFIVTSIGCRKPKEKFIEHYTKPEITTGMYDCSKLNHIISNKYYLDFNFNPLLNGSDSANLIEYANEHNQIKYAIENGDTSISKLLYLLPRIRGIINSTLYDAIIDNNQMHTNGLSNTDSYDLVISDAVIAGTVFRKFHILDSNVCYYYKTEYLIRVTEVFHSYFPIQVGDLVLLKSTEGYVGGCNSNISSSLVIKDHSKEYNLNDKWIFLLKHNDYYSKFITRINVPKYQDVYCPHAFELYDGNQSFDYNNKSFISKLKEFCKTI